MSTVAVVLIVVGAVLLLLFVGGFVAARRRIAHPDRDRRIAAVDQALEQARAGDRGWDRDAMAGVAGKALRSQRPDFSWEAIELVLVDDRPGVEDDRAHLVARGAQGEARVILARRTGGEWFAESIG
jgi:hypothetical protein